MMIQQKADLDLVISHLIVARNIEQDTANMAPDYLEKQELAQNIYELDCIVAKLRWLQNR